MPAALAFLANAAFEWWQDGLADFDGSALQNAQVRPLTQAISARVYTMTAEDETPLFDGIRFLSRFGAEQELWTVFEQPEDTSVSQQLSGVAVLPLTETHPAVADAMRTLGLKPDVD